MLALATSPPSFGIAEGERAARDLYGLAATLRLLPGERDCNFHVRTADGREFVLKISSLEDAAGTDCLVQVLDHLAQYGSDLPVPRLFATLAGESLGLLRRGGTDYATCLVGYLSGRLLAETSAEAQVLESAGDALARLDHALQGFFHPSLTRRLAWDVRRLPELAQFTNLIEDAAARGAVEQVAAAFHGALPTLSGLRSQAIHGDCHATNLLIDSDGMVGGILDFGDMIHAPLIFEPGVAMSELLTEGVAPLDRVGALLRGYARHRGICARDVDALYDIICARHAVTLLVHGWRRRHDAAGASVLEAGAREGARSLAQLLAHGRERLTRMWQEDAGTAATSADSVHPFGGAGPGVDLERRRRLMGKGAELFYEKPLHLVRGSGVWLYDPKGLAYLDVYNNVAHVGHAHPHVVAAIQRQTAVLATHSRYLHAGILEYAERLTARLPAHLDACIFVNSGSEANDVAWRMARLATGRCGALVMENAYHGITDAVAALTPSTGAPREPRVLTIAPPVAALWRYDDVDEAGLAAAAADADAAVATLEQRGFAPAAFYIDTAVTSSGVFDPPAAWGRTLSNRMRAAGALIVADEVQYGLGRPGSHFWGFERRGIDPDIVTLGKPVANGFPMGVVVANRALIEALQAEFGFFSTFGGNAVAAAAAGAVLDVLDRERLMENAASTGEYLRGRLEAAASRHPATLGQVRGHGLLLGLEVLGEDIPAAKKRAKRIIDHLAARQRILIGYEGPHATILKLRPPLPFRREHADLLAEAIDAAAAALDA